MKTEVEIVRSRPLADRASALLARRRAEAGGQDGGELVPVAPSPEGILDGMTVEPIDETDIIRIGFRALDGPTAIEGVNAIADAYLEHRREMKENQRAAEFFEEKTELTRAEVERKRAELAIYKGQQGITDLTQQTEELIRQRANFENELATVRTTRAAREREIQVLERSRQENPEVLVPTSEFNNDPNLQSYQRRLAELNAKLNSLLSTYTPDSPPVLAVKRDVDACKQSIRAVVDGLVVAKRNELIVLRGREESQEAELAAIEARLDRLPAHEARVAHVTQELRSLTDQLISLESRHAEYSVQEAVDPRVSNLQLLSHAVSAKRIGGGSRQKLFAVFSFILAVGMAVATAFLVDTLDHTLKFPAEVETALGVPVLASVREVRVGRGGARVG
jgi:uncharacterized protein involved in exopolysaccharide biosynthesis